MSFKKNVQDYLGSYKKKVLGISKHGKWWINKKDNQYVERFHILPLNEGVKKDYKYGKNNIRKLNLIEPYRDECWDFIIKHRIPLHQYFHHLTSSQGMCLNFFYPFFKERKLSIVLNSLGVSNLISDNDIDYSDVAFEQESSIDNDKQATSFDFYLSLLNGQKFYFEIKYTETGFGSKEVDEKSTKRFEEVYKKPANNVLIRDFQDPKISLQNYQIMRNLIHLGQDSFVIFIYPKGNTVVGEQGKLAKSSFLRKEYKNNLIVETWESLVKAVSEQPSLPDRLTRQIASFCEKYLQIDK
jgi:hypothetical protein